MSYLFFRCPKSGAEFNSGFRTTNAELKRLDPNARLMISCRLCGQKHEFAFVEGRIADESGR